ncbi:MAG: DUF2147 domain-containing protein [Pseudomonadota bacterium]|nr:DUF2147 domain-containing protein [Pseudomonadota bacterium]
MRRNTTMQVILLSLSLLALPVHAQQEPTGRWLTLDEASGKPEGIVEIYQARDGSFAGRVAEILDTSHGKNPLCPKCTGSNRGKPILGMVTLWGLRPAGKGHWSGGRVLDPKNGRTYKSKIELLNGGRKLGMSGCLGFICRQQIWIRQ